MKAMSINSTKGIQTDNVVLKTKIRDMGDWNMNYSVAGSSNISVAHGLTYQNIRSIAI